MTSKTKRSVAGKICSLLTPAERRSAGVLLGLMLIGMVLETLGVGLVIPVVVLLTQNDSAHNYPIFQSIIQFLGHPNQQSLVIGGMLILVGVYLFKALFLAFLSWRQNRFAFGLQAQLSQRLFTTYLRQPYTFHLQRNSAQLIRNAINEVNQFNSKIIIPALQLLTEGLVLLGITTLLLVVEPIGALIVMLVLGGVAWGFHHSTRSRLARWGQMRQYHDGLRLQHLQQGLGAAKDVKLLGREGDFLAQYRVHNSQTARMSELHQTLQQFPRLWLEVLAVVGLATLVLTMVLQKRDMASIVSALGLFSVAAFRLMPSVSRVLSAIQSLRYGLPVINTLHEELLLYVPGTAVRKTKDPVDFQDEIRLTEVSYTYPAAAAPTLNGLSLSIKKREMVGFIGPSGSGKSTLVDVILGLLTPSVGQVTMDGQNIQQNLRSWQDQIGYVPQSIYLTDDTLRRNVAFGLADEEINDTAVLRAIQAAQLEEFVSRLPQGLATVIGERGIRLSGGQRQRIGIARALYHDPAVLVLDEATSALDTITERSVMEAVTALQGSKTILIVAHRLSTVEQSDRLYRLHKGRVAEEGCPAAMLHQRRESITRTQA